MLEDDEDYVRLLYLVAYGLDASTSFHFVPDHTRIQKGGYGHPSGRITRGRKRAVRVAGD